MVAFSEVVGGAAHEVVPKRVHGTPAHGAGVKGVPRVEGNTEPPAEGSPVMGGLEDVGDTVMWDSEHPSRCEGLGLEA